MSERASRRRRPARARVGLAALGVGAIVAAGAFVAPSRADPRPLTAGSWDLVFADEFSGGELDEQRWATCYWWDDGGCTIASNEELEWYLPGNVAVSDGVLTLSARPEAVEGPGGRQFDFSSGMVSTGPRSDDDPAGFAFTYGYVEMSARLPAGRGLWPAFWMLPADFESRPEIDIMEVRGDEPTTHSVHLHTVDTSGMRQSHGVDSTGVDLSAGWHVYGLWWRDDELVWYRDGDEVWRYHGAGVPRQPMYLVANLAVGGEYAGPPDPATVFPAIYEIDFIRVWQEP